MKDSVAVVGGGLAGISAAINLCQHKTVHLFESSPQLGGRVRSYYDKDFDCDLDNGMHLMIGAYDETFLMLEKLNSIKYLKFMPLDISFHYAGTKKDGFQIKSNTFFPGSLHLFSSIFRSGILNFSEWSGLLRLMRDKNTEADRFTCAEILSRYGQSEKSVKYFWRPLILATLNVEPEEASADNLLNVLKLGFFKGWRASQIAFPKRPFSDIFATPAKQFLEAKSVSISLASPVKEIRQKEGQHWIRTGKEEYGPFQAVIMALPKIEINRILKENKNDFIYSPISSFYFRVEGNGLPVSAVNALLDSPLHWLFYLKDRKIYSITSSASDMKLNSENMEFELKKIFSGNWKIIHFKRIVSMRATPQFTPANKGLRNAESGSKSIFFAGDWVETGLPATIEGAVRSGRTAAEKVIAFLNYK